MVEAIYAALIEIAKPRRRIRCLMITGEGRAFCAGANLAGGAGAKDAVRTRAEPPVIASVAGTYHPLVRRIRDLEMPVVTAVNGPCVGFGVALALLLQPPARLWQLRDPLLILSVLPAVLILHQLVPIQALMYGTAKVSALSLSLLGQDVLLQGTTVWLPGGGVNVNPTCSGRNTISQIFAVAAIFVMAFPLRQIWLRLLILALSPLLGFIGNCIRIATLALINASDWAEKKYWFDFFHESEGSLVFSAITVSVFAWGYLKLMDHQLARKELQHA